MENKFNCLKGYFSAGISSKEQRVLAVTAALCLVETAIAQATNSTAAVSSIVNADSVSTIADKIQAAIENID